MTQKSTPKRGFCYTLNDYTEEEVRRLKSIDCVYHILGYEVGESGTPHIQGYMYFKNARSWNATKKKMERWHLEEAKGSADDNIAYCSKDGNYEELGKRPRQGERTDLSAIAKEIEGGKRVDEILSENPTIYHQYGRTLNKIEDLAMRNVWPLS